MRTSFPSVSSHSSVKSTLSLKGATLDADGESCASGVVSASADRMASCTLRARTNWLAGRKSAYSSRSSQETVTTCAFTESPINDIKSPMSKSWAWALIW
jgi:hypothetical protein